MTFKSAIISLFVMTTAVASAAILPSTGPDSYGYTGAPIDANLRNIGTTGIRGPAGDDVLSSPVPIGFNFSFYGTSYSQLIISTNGFVTFSDWKGANGCCEGLPLPTPSGEPVPGNLIAGFWTDLETGRGQMVYQTLGNPGSREFVVGFYDVAYCCGRSPSATFEIILREGSNNIELQYGRVTPGLGNPFSIGIENLSGTSGLTAAYGASTQEANLPSPQGYLFTAPVPEPSSFALIGLGIAGLAAVRRRRK